MKIRSAVSRPRGCSYLSIAINPNQFIRVVADVVAVWSSDERPKSNHKKTSGGR